jgi:aspartyl-tRNA synthetase
MTTFCQCGWVERISPRNGSFVLRNATGRWNLRPEKPGKKKQLEGLRQESVVEVVGRIVPPGQHGVWSRVSVLNSAKRVPFAPARSNSTPGRQRARYRYLEIRDGPAREMLMTRHRAIDALWRFLSDRGFVSVETPILGRRSATGAEQFTVVDKRTGKRLYELPQSPQVYGQLLACSGIERYFQFARCFRNEDLRANRQPEFTQLNLEMAFATTTELMSLVELGIEVLYGQLGLPGPDSFTHISAATALSYFGSDRPDLRYQPDLRVVGGANGTPHAKRFLCAPPLGIELTPGEWQRVIDVGRKEGLDLVGFSGHKGSAPGRFGIWVGNGEPGCVHHALYEEAKRHKAPAGNHFVWVGDYPLFSPSPPGARSAVIPYSTPFVAPKEPDALMGAENAASLLEMKGEAFDLVLNGEEIASGSVLNHRRSVQTRIFELIDMPQAEVEHLGFLLESLEYGAPPVVGLGLGLDRLLAQVCGAQSLREVIAFPKTKKGQCPVTSAGGKTIRK